MGGGIPIKFSPRKRMQLFTSLASARLEQASVLSVGVFDGVHLGHHHLFATVKKIARQRNLLTGAVALDPHPREVLKPEVPFRYLTAAEERVKLLEALGLDFLVVQPFSLEFSHTTAREFVLLLRNNLRMEVLVAGPDFALGHGREGDLPTLRRLGQELGFSVEIVEPLEIEGVPVRSTIIRSLIQEGLLPEAGSLLGRPFTVSGLMERSASQAKDEKISLQLGEKQILPPQGRYAARLVLGEKRIPAEVGVQSGEESEHRIEVDLKERGAVNWSREIRLEIIQRLPAKPGLVNLQEFAARIKK